MAVGQKLVYLFSGGQRPFDAVEIASILGCAIDPIDVVRGGPEHNLMDQHIWEALAPRFKTEEYDGGLMSPPCSTYSVARSRPGGPPPLRGELAPEIYGYKDLRPADKEKVKIGTLLSIRASEAADSFDVRNAPWAVATPQLREGCPIDRKISGVARY